MSLTVGSDRGEVGEASTGSVHQFGKPFFAEVTLDTGNLILKLVRVS